MGSVATSDDMAPLRCRTNRSLPSSSLAISVRAKGNDSSFTRRRVKGPGSETRTGLAAWLRLRS